MALPEDAAAHNGSAAQTEVPCVAAGHTGLTVPSVTAGQAVHTGEHMRTDSQQRAAESLNPERAADSVARVHQGILAKWNRQVTGSYRPVGFRQTQQLLHKGSRCLRQPLFAEATDPCFRPAASGHRESWVAMR